MFSSLVTALLVSITRPNLNALAQHPETCQSDSEECIHTSLLQTKLTLEAPPPSASLAVPPAVRDSSNFKAAALLARSHNVKLERFIKEQMNLGKIPGLSAVVLHNDKVLWDGHYGSTDPESEAGPSVQSTTLFQFASLSKTLISVTAMILKEKGLLDPEDDVNKYLPFNLVNPHFPETAITVHGLLTHTSSMTDHVYGKLLKQGKLSVAGDPLMSMAAFYNATLSKRGQWYNESVFLRDKPQVRHLYCNMCACLAGYIVELIAQKNGLASSFDKFVTASVLKPLGITHAGYFVEDLGGLDALAPPAGALPGTYSKITSDSDYHNGYQSLSFYGYPDYADGTFKASVLDYARIFGAFINNGNFQGVQLLKPETIKYMKKVAGSPCSPQPCNDYHSCWMQTNSIFLYWDLYDRVMLGHNALDKGINGAAFYNYETGIGYVVMTNGDATNNANSTKAFEAIAGELMRTFDSGGEQPKRFDEDYYPKLR